MHLTWTYTTLDNLPAVNVLSDASELGPGQCGGKSCPESYEDMLAETRQFSGSGSSKVHHWRETGGGRRVLRSTKSLT